MKKRNGPTTNRHRSAQDHGTPREFISAIECRFDLIGMDLAATSKNHVHPNFISRRQNSLKQDWTTLLAGKMGYLNPPFDPITPWIDKCVEEAVKGARFVVLSRASVDSRWFWKMFPLCAVYALGQRIRFVGSKAGYPSPLILSAFNVGHWLQGSDSPIISATTRLAPADSGGLFRWDWKRDIGDISE